MSFLIGLFSRIKIKDNLDKIIERFHSLLIWVDVRNRLSLRAVFLNRCAATHKRAGESF